MAARINRPVKPCGSLPGLLPTTHIVMKAAFLAAFMLAAK
jgi:hypothetical protein